MLQDLRPQLLVRSQQLISDRLSGDRTKALDEFNAAIKLLPVLSSSSQLSSSLLLLLRIIGHDDVAVESALLASNSYVRLMISSTDEETEVLKTIEELITDSSDSFTQLCLCEGVLNCGDSGLILKLLVVVIDKVLDTCHSNRHGVHTFRALRLASVRLRELALQSIESEEMKDFFEENFNQEHPRVQRVLDVISYNFDNTLKGLSELLSETLDNLFTTLKTVHIHEEFKLFIKSHLEMQIRRQGFRKRVMFATLNAIFLHVDVSQVIDDHPKVQSGLFECLSSNHLVSTGSVVYRTVLRSISSDFWHEHFLHHLLGALLHEESLIQCNAKKHFLPATLQLVENAYKMISDHLHNFYEESDSAGAKVLGVKLCLIKCQRQLGQLEVLQPGHLEIVQSGLFHLDRELRINSFSVLCQLKNRSVPPTPDELRLIIKFVKSNLSVDSASFRRQVMSDANTFLIRIRDFLARKARKDPTNLQTDQVCQTLLSFLDSFLELLFDNLFPSANYQRLITSLSLLDLISELFFVDFDSNRGCNKRSGDGNPSLIINFCDSKNIFQFTSLKHVYSLLSCAVSFMDDVRLLSNKLLRLMISLQSNVTDTLLLKTINMLCSPSTAECEAGANLIVTLKHWDPNAFGGRFEAMLEDRLEPFIRASEDKGVMAIKRDDSKKTCNMKQLLLRWYKKLVRDCESNLLNLARRCPMHGLLTAIRLLCNDESEDDESFFDDVVEVLKTSTSLMMSLLSGSETDDSSASFETMGKAIEAIIEAQKTTTKTNSSVAISEDEQLVLALCWLNIKEGCLLASKASSLSSSSSLALSCGQLLMDVLVRCRHKGVMEATQVALLDWSKHTQSDCGRAHIASSLLSQLLSEVSNEAYRASATRRSAGIPMIVQSLLAGENEERRHRPLLRRSIETLTNIINEDNKQSNNASKLSPVCKDTPRQHALHILRAIVHHSVLGQFLTRDCQVACHVIVTCLHVFSSIVWSERNAALQLFGALVPRLIGQKKNNKDNLGTGVMGVDKFVQRFHNVMPFILQKLEITSDTNGESVVPLLSLMSQLAPDLTHTNLEAVMQLRNALHKCLRSKEWRIRQLAAKSFNVTVANDELKEQSDLVFSILMQCCRLRSNTLNGNLLLLNELAPRLDPGHLRVQLDLLNVEGSYKDWCVANQMLLKRILSFVNLKKQLIHVTDLNRIYEPFYRDFSLSSVIEDANEDPDRSIRDHDSVMIEAHGFFLEFIKCQKSPNLLLDFVEGHVNSKYLSLTIADMFITTLITSDDHKTHPMRTLSIVNLLRHKFTTNSIETKAILVITSCISSTLETKEDLSSEYIAESLTDLVSLIERLSSPLCIETQRLNAAKALMGLTRVFDLNSSLPISFPDIECLVVRLVNVALRLFYDEDEDVRLTVESFVSQVVHANDDLHVRLLLFVLDMVKETENRLKVDAVISMLVQPIEQGIFQPSCLSSDQETEPEVKQTLSDRFRVLATRRRRLFESGDGINVFIEPVRIIEANTKALDMWLSRDANSLRMEVQLDVLRSILDELHKIVVPNLDKDNIEFFVDSNCDKAYVMLRHMQATLNLWVLHTKKLFNFVESKDHVDIQLQCDRLADMFDRTLMMDRTVTIRQREELLYVQC